jgi:hypothetical protein
MKRLLLPLCFALASSCAGFRALDRGEWVMVWTDESVSKEVVNGTPIEVTKPAPGARKEIIPQERYDSEVAEGKRRGASAPLGEVPKAITQISGPVELMVGEVRELIVDERTEAQVLLAGDCVRPYWTRRKDVAGWKGDQPDDHKESSLFLLADDPGSAKVKVVYPGKDPVIVEVQVHAK